MDGIPTTDENAADNAGTGGGTRPSPAGRLRARPDERGPLSFGQQRLWFLDRWLGDNAVYNIPVVLRFTGPLDAARLTAAVTTAAAGHDALYTVFEADGNGEPRQRLLDTRETDCPLVDLTGLAPADRARSAREAVEADARRPFDLARDPMLRASLYRLAENEHWLQLTFHHIACDGWSLDVFQRRLNEAYRGVGGSVEQLPVQYADYALWQRETLRGPRTEKALAAWTDTLADAPAVLDLGTDRPRPAEMSYRGETTDFPLTGVSSAALEAFAAEENVSLYTVMLAAFQVLAARHSGSSDVVVGSPVAGRDNAKLNDLVGFFVDTLVLRVDLGDDPCFRELVARSRASLLSALSRSRAPFDLAVKQLHPERSLSHNPIVQTLFAFHEEEPLEPFGEGLSVERSMVATGTAKFDITWSVYRRPGGLHLQVEYATDLFDADTIRTLVDHWQILLGQILATPDLPVSRLPLMGPAERELLESWAGDGGELPVGAIHELVIRRALETPDAVAVVCDDTTLTYAELVTRAAQIATLLIEHGVGPEVCVGICVERSPDTVITTLAVLMAHGVYVPLDTAFPTDRMHHMLTEVDATLVLTHQPTHTTIPHGPWHTLNIDTLQATTTPDLDHTLAHLPQCLDPDHACYIIFTSGSTGRPKGTTVTHANVTRLFSAVQQRLPFGPDDTWSLFHSYAFDVSVMEMWGALTTGGRLVVVPYLTSRDSEAFYALVRDRSVTMLSQTPSAFRQFETVDAVEGGELGLRAVLFAGEALNRASVRRWGARHRYASPLLVNLYGITETTVHVTYTEVDEDQLDGTFSRIGRALPDLRLYVLDPSGDPSPIGVIGELHVGGPGVTRCYTGQPALTAQRFVPDHLGRAPGARLYRSGDLARWTPSGDLEYLGRADAQVKVRGYRIELPEIEARLGRRPEIRQAVVVVRDDLGGHTDLVAYLVPEPGTDRPTTSALRDALAGDLPEYMIPRNFVFLDALPLTPQGKLNHRALPAPTAERPELTAEFIAPLPGTEELLARIWSSVLGVDRIGRQDNFFDLGGDSIRSIQVLGLARAQGVGFELQDLFRTPTLAGLAEAASTHAVSVTPQRDREPFSMVSAEDRARLPQGLVDAYPMAELQVGMIYEMELDRERLPYHNVDSMRINGRFDERSFKEALRLVVERHPILRTSLELSGYSEPLQLVHATAEMPCVVSDLRALDDEAQQTAIAAYVTFERSHMFDHSRPPLLRFGIHWLSDDAFQWTVTEHHAIFDGWSLHSTLAEITGLYHRLATGAGTVAALDPPESAYRDFIAAEREVLRSKESEAFWLERLTDRPIGRLPRWPDRHDAALATPERENEWRVQHTAEKHGSIETLLPAELCDELLALAKRCGVPLKSVMLAAHLRVMSLVTGSRDVLAGLSSNGRLEEAGATEVRGLFLNTVPFRLELPEGSWLDLVRAVFEAEQDMLPHRRYPLGALQRRMGGEALFETSFVYNHFHVLTDEFGEGRLTIVDGKIDSFSTLRAEPTNFPLSVGVIRNPYSTRLLLSLDYHLGVLVEDQVALMRDYYVRVLESMVCDPDTAFGDIVLLGDTERELLESWAGDGGQLPVGAIHELVIRRALETPDAVAVVCDDTTLTYAELVTRAAQIATLLIEHGVGPEVCVGICVERSPDTVITTLAVLMAHGVYVPLDTAFPTDRMHHMLTEVDATLVLTHQPTHTTIPHGPWHTLNIDTLPTPETTHPLSHTLAHLPHHLDPDHASYIIFTSGSTGRPKGTTVTHANVTRLLNAVQQRLPFGTDDTWTLFHSYAFDFSVWEMWGALTTGGRLVVVPYLTSRDADAFYTLVHDQAITLLSQTPSAFRQFEATDHTHNHHLALRAIVFGGEALDTPSVRRWTNRHGTTTPRLINMYGITETTVHVTTNEIDEHQLNNNTSRIGRPLPDLRLRIMDQHGHPAPIGVIGELYVSGAGLARGYEARPALTAERFVPDHLGQTPGSRLYRSGDLARWTPAGDLEYLGRADAQVKIRGYRIELGEIEAQLARVTGLLEAVVLPYQEANGRTDLVAYLVPETGTDQPTTSELRDALADHLPDYMIPRNFVLLDTLPLTPQGKLDRRSLPAPTTERPILETEFIPPLPGTEEALATIWADILGVDRIGRHDNFFDLGGDSIRSIQILGRARDNGLTFHLQDLFHHPTLADLATTTTTTQATITPPTTQPFSLLTPHDRNHLPHHLDDAYPMAELQIGMVYEMQRDPDRNPYLNVTSLHLPGRFEQEAFRAAVSMVVERHPVLRTSFDLSGLSVPMQLVHAEVEMPVGLVDLRGLSKARQRRELADHVRGERTTGFDPAVAPLFRMTVHVLSDDAFQWTVTDHHAILDGWSLASTLAEITDTYHTLLDGNTPTLPPLRSTYRDYIAAEQAALTNPAHTTYWHGLLTDRPDTRLPRHSGNGAPLLIGERLDDEVHEHDGTGGYGALVTVVPPELLSALEDSAARIGVPFKAVVLAAHMRVLSLVTGSADVVTGLSSNGRLEETDGTEVRGLFLNSLPFRLRLPDGTWADLARAVFDAEREMLPHRRYPMPALQRALGGDPLFETGFVYNHFRHVDELAEGGRASVSGPHDETAAGVARTSFPLHVAMSREPGLAGMRMELEYDAREFPAEQMRLIRDYHLRALRAIAENPDGVHRAAVLLGEAERALLERWNDNTAAVPSTPVHELIEARAAAQPHRVAVVAGERSLTYGELDARADRLARHLRRLGVGPEVFVGVGLDRSPELVVGLLAVLKAGGAYVPLDVSFPADRLAHMLREADVRVVLAGASTRDLIPRGPWETVDVDTAVLPEETRRGRAPEAGAGPDNACYAIFTSGSTGRPKGVVTRHRNVTELLHGGPAMELREDDTVLQIATVAFDVSTFEIWAPLAAGARLVLAPPGRYAPADVAGWVTDHGVTVLHAAASLFTLLVDEQPQTFDGLRRLLTGSETVSAPHAGRILARCPELELVNCWGPTETTTFSVCGIFTADSLPAGPLPLGTPLANTEVRVLDEAGHPVPVGSPGELYVAGPCLARGYLGAPALTAEHFLPHPSLPGARLYRTGDRGRWSAEGQVEFLGRVDHMVKIRGYRVEPGEVSAAIGAHPRVRQCVVTAPQDASGRTDLVAYLVCDAPAPDVTELRSALREKLPEYMLPQAFVFLDAFPLTAQGKVDRGRLPAPSGDRPELSSQYVAPLPGVEERLAVIWRQVLGVDRIGRHDNFFDLGGDSIRSIQVIGRTREEGLLLTLPVLFRSPTLAALGTEVTSVAADLLPAPTAEPFALLSAQDRQALPEGLVDAYPMAALQVGMVYEMEIDPDRNPYHNVSTVRLGERFEEDAFRRAVELTVSRHDVLRTSFDLSGYSEPVQLVHERAESPLTVVDLRGQDDSAQRAAVAECVRREQDEGFSVAVAPLFRMTVHVLSDDAFQWTVTDHHAILDGWSLASTLAEITDTYHTLLDGNTPTLPPLRSTYRDYIAAEQAALTNPAHTTYWRGLLTDRPDTRLPRHSTALPDGLAGLCGTGEVHRNDAERRHGELITSLPVGLGDGLDRFARHCGVPLKSVLLAAHLRVMSLATGSRDVVTGLSSNGRLEETDGTEVRGLFLNTLPFRLELPEGSWRDLARAVFEAEQDMLPHRRYPMSAIQRELGGEPLFETGFVYNHFRQIDALAGGADTDDDRARATGGGRTHFPLLVAVSQEPGHQGLSLEMEYDSGELSPVQVALMRDYYVRVLESMVCDPDTAFGDIVLLGDTERELLESWAGDGGELPVGAIHELVIRRALETPDAVAVVCDDTTLTYTELVTRAAQIATLLIEHGVGPEVCVGICVERSPDTVITTLAVLMAHGVYVPLDTAFPTDRMHHMLTEVDATLVLTHQPTHTTIPHGPWHTLNIDTLQATTTPDLDHTLAHLPQRLDPDHACYIIFTSGSTGRPKGTTVTHANVTRLLNAVQQRLPFGTDDTWTLFHSYAFDFSVWEMWGALTTGGRLVVVPYLTSRDADAFYTLVHDQAITLLSQTPSAFRQFEATDHTHNHHLALRAIVFGGEALDTPSVRRWTNRHGTTTPRLINMYGITETTVHVTTNEIDEHQLNNNTSRIGRPLPDLRLHVLDPYGNPTPIGVVGELHVGGAGLARGYTGQPALTAQRFVPDHLTPSPGSRLYRSGDLARWTPAGDLEYLGRADAQVKIRGYRIELGEIEDQLARLDAVLQAVVVVRDDLEDRADLVAYLVPEPGTDQPTTSELRDALADHLPDYMIPRNFVLLDALPLTPQGKLNQRALPAPTSERPDLSAEFIAPLPGTEELLAAIWTDILGVDRIGRHDNFFDLGGDSIRSIQILGRARDNGLTFHLQDLFHHPTLADLATTTTTTQPTTTPPTTQPFSLLTPHDRNHLPHHLDDAYPMAELQIGMVYEMQRDPDRNPYLNVENLPVAGPFDAPLFRRALALVVKRHPVLRTSLALTGYSKPLQLVHTEADVQLTVLDLRGLGDDAQRTALRECVRTERAKVFDIGAAPLFRMTVHVLSDDAFQWTVTDHHAILDGWSLASTLAEIIDTYHTLLDGSTPSLPPLRSTYRDYIAAEQEALTNPAHTTYWLDLLTDRPDTRLRCDSAALSDEPGYRNVTTHLPPQLLAALEHGAAQAGVPLKAVLLAAHLRALGLATGSPDVITGLTANGRLEETDGTEVRGLFLNTVPFRLLLAEGSWADLARAVFDAEREMLPHRRYPMAALRRELGGAPLFEVNFTYNSFPQFGALAEAGALAKEGPGNDVPGVAPTSFPFSVTLSRESVLGGMWMELEYDTAELSADQVTRLRDYHLRALEAVAADIGADAYGTPLLSESEQALLDMLNYTTDARAAGRVPVHELLRRQAARTPDALAIEDGGTRISLARLDADSDRLARRLRRDGVRHGDLVGIFLRPGSAALTTFWAVWKAGAAFVPLDPGLPEHRLRSMLDQARPVVLVTDDPKAAPSGHRLFDLSSVTHEAMREETGSRSGEGPDSSALPSVSARDLAYVMFTSGTTGGPKGVMIEHGSLAAYAVGTPLARTRSLGAERPLRVVTGTSAYISDFLLAQVLLVLDGHTLCVLNEEQRRDPGHLVALAHDRERAVDVIDTTTVQLQLLVEQGLLDAPWPPRLLVFGGEACPPDLWAALAARSGVQVFNSYGPAEATVEATVSRVTGDGQPVIGRPCANARIHLLDAAGREVPPGTAGEICVGGAGVGRGYLGRPGATAERFVPDPWGPAGSRLYRTGDVGRLTDSGDLEFLGRVDHQLKVLGERVEPEEVEAVLRAHPGVAGAIVGRHPDHEGLLANVVPAQGGAPDQRELRRHAASRLSSAAVPAHFVVVDALPLTPAGKLDRGALLTTGPGTGPEGIGTSEEIRGPGEPVRGTTESAFSRTERRVAEVWHKLLGLRADRQDDFFSIGGHSLLAVRLAGELGTAFGTTVPLPQLYSTPTLAGQAAYLDDARHEREGRGRSGGPRSVIGLGGSPGLQPLVLVHPLGGTLFCYRDLTARISGSFEVLGVQGDLMGGGDTADFASLASGYARELAPLLRGRRPVIAGWSAGGVLAHEVASRLADRGIVADRVVVIDAAPRQGPDTAADAKALERLRIDVARLGPRRLLAEHAIDDVLRLLGVDAEALAELNGPVTASLMEFWQGMLSGLAGHRPSFYPGPVHLVVSRRSEEAAVRAQIAGWERCAGTLRVSYTDGDHYQLMREPWIGDVAKAFAGPDDPTDQTDGGVSGRS